jgi:hypothetical protein
VMSAKTNAEWYDTLAWLYGSTGLGEAQGVASPAAAA